MKIIELLVTIQKDWSKLKSETECEIMKKHLDQGKKLTLFISSYGFFNYNFFIRKSDKRNESINIFTVWYYNSMVVFLLLPMRPKVMTWLGLSQGPADFDFPYPVNYGVDHDKYFYAIETHISFCSTLVITTIIAADTLFIVLVQHICGIFKIIRFDIFLMIFC